MNWNQGFYFCHHIYATSFSTPASLPMDAKGTCLCNFVCECLLVSYICNDTELGPYNEYI